MPGKERKHNPALYTLAGTVVTTLGAIATNKTPALLVTFIVIAAILLVFTLVLWYQWKQDGARSKSQAQADKKGATRSEAAVDLHPERLAGTLEPLQRETVELALGGVVSDVANEVGMPARLVRSNLFSCLPDSRQLGMVQGLWCHMDRPEEWTIRMEVGKGSAGLAWLTGDANRVIWNGSWGENEIGDDSELKKVHPELRWILTVPIFGARSAGTKLVLNVDGLQTTPSVTSLDSALGHLPRFGQGISRVLSL